MFGFKYVTMYGYRYIKLTIMMGLILLHSDVTVLKYFNPFGYNPVLSDKFLGYLLESAEPSQLRFPVDSPFDDLVSDELTVSS